MKTALIVSRDIYKKKDGGTLVSIRNERIIKKLGYNIERFIIPQPSMKTRLHNYVFKESYGETKKLKKEFIKELKKGYDFIFFDGSIYGGFLKIAHNYGCRCICFYHNVEYIYYSQKSKSTKKIIDKLFIPYIKYNEALSTKLSDSLITLTSRDSDGLNMFYGRPANLLMPTSFEDRKLEDLYEKRADDESPYLLFVGTNFFANIEGLSFFIERVAPYIKLDVLIAGNIEESFKGNSNVPDNVKFLGVVDSLDYLYVNATAVIAPIFSGSGLKTKTAEALSYGKTVIGTDEALSGINTQDYPNATFRVNSDRDFIEVINNLPLKEKRNNDAVKLFQECLSDNVFLNKLRSLVNSLDVNTQNCKDHDKFY